MNVRCYRCGWSSSLSRETIAEAAVSSAGQKAYVIHCPRCRRAIRIPMDQIMRALPPGWTPPARADEQTPTAEPAATGKAATVDRTAAAEPAGSPEKASEPVELAEQAQRRSERKHRHSGKANSGNSAAFPAAKKSTHPT